MAKETITKCDGCGVDGIPMVTAMVTITELGNTDTKPNAYDVCDKCWERLHEVAYPNAWPRRKRRKASA